MYLLFLFICDLCTGAVLFSISSRTTMEISIYTFCVILRNIYILYYVFLCFYCEINQYKKKYKKYNCDNDRFQSVKCQFKMAIDLFSLAQMECCNEHCRKILHTCYIISDHWNMGLHHHKMECICCLLR